MVQPTGLPSFADNASLTMEWLLGRNLNMLLSGAATAIIGILPASRGQLLPGYLMLLLLHPSLTPPQARICQPHLLPFSPGEPAWWRSRVKMLVLTLLSLMPILSNKLLNLLRREGFLR